MPKYSEIYNFLGDNNLNNINYNEHHHFDVHYNYQFRQGETQTFNIVPSSSIDFTNYDSFSVSMYVNNEQINYWSGQVIDFTGSTGEIFLDGSTLTLNLTKEKSKKLPAGILYIALMINGTSSTEYQIYLGEVFVGLNS